MPVHRAFNITFYLLYLILLAVTLYFLLYYAEVPVWVWSLFGIAILIAVIGVVIKETTMKRKKKIKKGGVEEIEDPKLTGGWSLSYHIFHVIAVILVVTGIILTAVYAKNVPWWVWLILGLAIVIAFLGPMIHASTSNKNWKTTSLFFSMIASILYISGLIFFVIYSNSPWWIWLLIVATVVFQFLGGALEFPAEENIDCVEDENDVENKSTPENTPALQTL
jgi:phosphatidylglycerophosphate synthase